MALRTLESWSMVNGKKGSTFFSDKLPRHLTAIATQHSRKITTEKVLVIETNRGKPELKRLTKVTLV